VYKPQIPKDATEALKRKRLHNAGDLKAHAGRVAQPEDKRKVSEEIDKQTRKFLRCGGKIQRLETSESGYQEGGRHAFVIKASTNSNAR